MALMIHRPGPPAFQKVLLAAPVSEKFDPGTTFALFEMAKALERAGIASELAIHAYDCHVDDSRNRLVRQLLIGNCTDLFFLDADVRCEADLVVELLTVEADVVGALYPLKQEGPESYALELLDDKPMLMTDARGLLEVMGFATGCMRIRRHVLERLAANAALYWGKGDKEYSRVCAEQRNPATPLIFERTLGEPDEQGVYQRVGGDLNFCRKARAVGFQVWIYPETALDHTGARTWRGHFGNFLRRNMMKGESHGQRNSDHLGKDRAAGANSQAGAATGS